MDVCSSVRVSAAARGCTAAAKFDFDAGVDAGDDAGGADVGDTAAVRTARSLISETGDSLNARRWRIRPTLSAAFPGAPFFIPIAAALAGRSGRDITAASAPAISAGSKDEDADEDEDERERTPEVESGDVAALTLGPAAVESVGSAFAEAGIDVVIVPKHNVNAIMNTERRPLTVPVARIHPPPVNARFNDASRSHYIKRRKISPLQLFSIAIEISCNRLTEALRPNTKFEQKMKHNNRTQT
jgi:hypothetical protein